MKLLKKNQVIIYAIAVMLMVVGYLNYTTRTGEALETSSSEVNESNIGDARLVSSNPVEENILNETNTVSQELSNNETENELVNETSSDIAQETSSSSNNSDDYFTKSKLERDTMYSQMLETYENVLNSSNSLETQKQSATEEITKINAPDMAISVRFLLFSFTLFLSEINPAIRNGRQMTPHATQ